MFHLLIHFPYGYKRASVCIVQTRVSCKFSKQMMGPALGPSSIIFLQSVSPVGWKVEQPEHKLALIWNAGIAGGNFHLLYCSAAILSSGECLHVQIPLFLQFILGCLHVVKKKKKSCQHAYYYRSRYCGGGTITPCSFTQT